MKNKMKRHQRSRFIVPFVGILLASTCFSALAYAQEAEGSLDFAPLKEIVIEKEEVIPGLSFPVDFLNSSDADVASNLPTSQIGASNSYGQFEYGAGPEDLVLAVVSKRKRLSAGIFAVQNNGRYYLPVAGLSQIFGFYYDYEASERYIEGWGLSESDKYSIDARNGILRFRNEKVDLPSDAVLEEEFANDDLYVSIDVLNEVWPLQMDVNLSALNLNVIPDSKLPFELANQRKMARDRALLSREERLAEEAKKDFPLVPYPYQLWSNPSLDLSSLVGYRAETDSSVASVSATGINDLLHASADYSITAQQNDGDFIKPERFRFRLRRQNIHEGALPFGLEDTQLGDVSLRNRELISSGAGGRGFIFSSEPNDKTGEFDVVTIDGVSVPGWDVELYLNNELIDFDVVSADGEYRFEDVSIGFGNNRFRVVLYGPQGQIRERVENYLYQASMVEVGKTVFAGGVVDAQRSLFPIDDRNSQTRAGLTANLYAARGINPKLTAFTSLNTVRDRDFNSTVSRQYASAGVIGTLGTTIGQAEVYKQFDGGEALDVRTLSDFYGFKVNGQVSLYRDFESPDASFGENAKKIQTDFSVKRIFATLVGALGLELRQNYLERENGTSLTRYTTRQSLGVKGVRMTNVTTSNLTDGDHSTSTGRISASTRYNRWNLRNTLGYNLHPEVRAQTFQLDMRYGRTRDWTTGINANYNFTTKEKRLGFQISKDFQKYLASAETNWSSIGGFGFIARMSASLGPYGDGDDGYIFRSQPLQNVGSAEAFLYNDRDYDGVFTEGDEPIEQARISIGRRATKDKTNESGLINEFYTANSNKINVSVTPQSVENPYLVSKNQGYKIFARPGVKQKLEFPMMETGAIDGTLRWSAEGKPIAGVRMQLLDDEGTKIQETQTAVDGYYTFEQIPPGGYTIRPNPEDGLDIPFQYVDVSPDDLFKFGTDINGIEEGEDLGLQGLDLGPTEFSNDGTLNVKDIISMAKGYKSKSNFQKAAYQADKAMPAKAQKASINNNEARAVVKSIRVGDHSDKIRIVMDLSAPVDYEINYDPQSNMIFIEMPYVSWSANDKWSSETGDVISGYEVQKIQDGIKMILSVTDNIEVGAAGLLKATANKDDRLFIDIEKK